jgi:hypothetical protein
MPRRLLEQRGQAGPEGRHSTRSADDECLAVHEHLIARVRVGHGRDVGHAAPHPTARVRRRWVETRLVGRDREMVADPAPGCPRGVPHGLTGDRPARRLECRATAGHGKRGGRRKVCVGETIGNPVGGPVVPAGTEDVDAERVGGLEGGVHCVHRLRRPVGLRRSPADRDDGDVVGRVVDSRVDSVQETLVSVGCEIDHDGGSRRDRPCHLDVQVDLAVGAVGITGWMVRGPVDGYGDDVRRWTDPERGEVVLQIRGPETASELDDADCLAAAPCAGWKLVELGQIKRGEGAGGTRCRAELLAR